MKNPNVSTVITGASKPEQVTENMKAEEIAGKLDESVLRRVDECLGVKPDAPED